MSEFNSKSDRPGVTLLGKLVIFAFIAACGWGAYRLFLRSGYAPASMTRTSGSSSSGIPGFGGGRAPEAEIGIAYGTEKRNWLEWAVREFAKSEAGSKVKVNLIPFGSLEGAQALVSGDKRIHVWSPASSLYKDTFVQDWQLKYSTHPIAKEESLALTPMVFVMWEERHAAFQKKFGQVTFETVAKALAEQTGWEAVAAQPDWGLFKFGHTVPNESNSGLMTLVLMAYEHHKKNRNLSLGDVVNASFQKELTTIERAASVRSNSTGSLMREMVLKGPSAYDAIFVYESVAIDYLKSAQGRWGELRVVYPRLNMWNDNPYYIINSEWSSPDQKKAAEVFLEFLMSEPVQKQALTHGFRPGNPSVPVVFPESPFVAYQKFGLRNDIGQVCDYPKGEVINNLLAAWQRVR